MGEQSTTNTSSEIITQYSRAWNKYILLLRKIELKKYPKKF